MAKTKARLPADYIVPINMNGLQGRMLHIPAKKSTKRPRDIIFVYGHHSSLERWWGVVDYFNQYGSVTMPDLPGFGGMQSYYRLGKKPTIDNLADYLATFIKFRFSKKQKLTIIGLSFGFAVATRMLQKHPSLRDRVELLVSVVGFSRSDDFTFSKPRYWFYLNAARFFRQRVPAILFKNIFLNPAVLRLGYARTHNAQEKFEGLSHSERKAIMAFEIHLWHCNDVRTYMYTSTEFLTLDNCKHRVDLPLWHIAVKNDRYFDTHTVVEHLKVIYDKVNVVESELGNHAPSVIADKKAAAAMIPPRLRNVLSRGN